MNEKENIILIIIDAFRPKNLSLFGYAKETDKNLKKIAKENIWFKNCFSASNSTAPSVTSILTGKYPNNHGIFHQLPYTKEKEIEKINQEKFWLPEYLKNFGYETTAIDWIGMWFKRGFDYYGEGEEQGILRNPNSPFISANQMINLAISKIKQSRKPFFLMIHLWDTHFPFPNIPYYSQGNEEDLKNTLKNIKNQSQREYLKKRVSGKGLNTIQDMEEKYDLSIMSIDKEIGRFVEFLKKEGLWDDLIFAVLGDHGENSTEHDIYFSPSGLYEESIHVPFIMHLPGYETKEITGFVQNVDIVPTILDYLEINTIDNFDGKSMLPLIRDNQPIRDKVFLFDGLCADIKGVRTYNKKLIIAKDNFCNLCKSSHHKDIEEYDLEQDPEEKNNVYSGGDELIRWLV